MLFLFFRKEQDSSFSAEKEAKRLLLLRGFEDPGLGRIVTTYQHLQRRGVASNDEQGSSFSEAEQALGRLFLELFVRACRVIGGLQVFVEDARPDNP